MELKMSDVQELYQKEGSTNRVVKVAWESLRIICRHEQERMEKGFAVDESIYQLSVYVIDDLLMHGATLQMIAEEIQSIKNKS